MGLRSSPYRQLDCLKKYERVDRDIIVKSSRIIVSQYDLSPFIFRMYFSPIVNATKEEAEKTVQQYACDIGLLEDIYLKYLNNYEGEDHEGILLAQIIKNDPSFLELYIDYGLDRAPHSYSLHNHWGRRLFFVWEEEDYLSIMSRISDCINEKAPDELTYSSLITPLLSNGTGKTEVSEKQNNWIDQTIKLHYNDEQQMIYLFYAIPQHRPDCRRNAFKIFLEQNKDFEFFKKLTLEAPDPECVWVGSRISILEQRIAFLESLLPLLAGLNFLDHKLRVNNEIEKCKAQIKNEEIHELLSF